MEKVGRNWYYIQKPAAHEISCTKCGGHNLEWSEFDKHVWCYDCKIDFSDYISALSGPVPMQAAVMMGICFDRYNMDTNDVDYYDFDKQDYVKMSIQQYQNLNKTKMVKKAEIEKVNAEEVAPLTDTISQELTKHNLTEALLSEMEATASTLEITGIDDKAGYDAVNKLRIAAKNTRVMTTKVCKSAREEHIRIQKEWVRTEKEITERCEKVEDALAAKQKIIDDEKDKIKLEKERIELSRLADRTALLTGFGMTYNQEDSSYVLDDIKLSVVQIKTYNDFVFTTLLSKVESKYKEVQEVKQLEDQAREEAALNAKRILEEQKAKEEELLKKEADLAARQKAIEDAELKSKQEAEAKIKAEEEAKLKAEKEKEAANKKAIEDMLKIRMSSLFALGFSQQGDQLHFNGNYISISQNIIQNHSHEEWTTFLKEVTAKVTLRKEELESERLAEIEKTKTEAAEKERAKIAAENEAKAKLEKEKAEADAKEQARLAALSPDIDKLNAFCKAVMDVPLPEFTSPAYQGFTQVMKAEMINILKNIHSKKPV